MAEETHDVTYYPDFVYSWPNRVLHWTRAISITALTVTGLYIAHPFINPEVSTDKLLFAEWVSWHMIFGLILLSGAILRFYLFFFERDKRERRSILDVLSLRSWIIQLKSYFFIGKLEKKGIYGPLQFVVYFIITGLVIMASVTGLILFVHVEQVGLGSLLYAPMKVIETWFGGLATVRFVHHVTMWGFIIFVPIHVYMVIWSAVRFKHNALDVMFTGYDCHLRDEHNQTR